jgi:hypothetical protein
LEDQSRTALRIADGDSQAVANLDRRHPRSVDEDAVVAEIDGHPLGAGEPQHHVGAGWWQWLIGSRQALQGNVASRAVSHDHVAAGSEDVSHGPEPYGQRGG